MLSNAIDEAAQRVKAKATARDIGASPKTRASVIFAARPAGGTVWG
jgi:hypothetical protein